MQSSAFEMVEMDKIVSGKRGWVTRASTEYARKGDRARLLVEIALDCYLSGLLLVEIWFLYQVTPK